FCIGTQRRLREAHRQIVHQIVTVALEPRIVRDLEDRDQIARRSVARARHTRAANREVVVVGDAGRHVDLYGLLGFDAALAAAIRAWARHDDAIAAAGRARRDREKLAEHGLRVTPDFARAAARTARLGQRAGLRAIAAAR